jgi:hypothetical protein
VDAGQCHRQPRDTFVNDTPPSDTHGPATNLLSGDDSDYGKCRDLFQFNLSSLSGDYIDSAAFEAYKFYQGSSSPTIDVAPMARPARDRLSPRCQ